MQTLLFLSALFLSQTVHCNGDREQLLSYCSQGKTAEVKAYFENKAVVEDDYSSKLSDRSLCLNKAAEQGHLEFIKGTAIAVMASADVLMSGIIHSFPKDFANPRREPGLPIVHPVGQGHLKVAMYLASRLPDGKIPEAFFYIFWMCSCHGNVDALKLFISELTALSPEEIIDENFAMTSRRGFGDPEGLREAFYPKHPLSCAAQFGHKETVAFLLSLDAKGAPIRRTLKGLSPVMAAISSGSLEIVKTLMAFPESDFFDNEMHMLAFIKAVASGNLDLVKWLHAEMKKRKMEIPEESRNVLKKNAANVPILQFLMELYGDKLPGEGLPLAVSLGRTSVVHFYLASPCFYSFEINVYGKTLNATAIDGNLNLLRIVHSKVAPIIGKQGIDKALIAAAENGAVGSMNVLIEEVSPSADPVQGGEVIVAAIAGGKTKAVQFLLDLNRPHIDPAALDNEGFIQAAAKGNVEMLKFLVSLHSKYPNIDPAARNNEAYFRATEKSYRSVVEYLESIKSQFPGIGPRRMEGVADKENSALRISSFFAVFFMFLFC